MCYRDVFKLPGCGSEGYLRELAQERANFVCIYQTSFFFNFNLFQKLVSLVSRQWPIKSQIMQEFPLTCAITIADKKILTAHVTARNQWYFIINTQAVGWDSGLSSSYFLDDTLESTRSKIS